ncbi:MAG TPA: response regulator, partial [Symbiobacteriaceae bacterium]|nr:response regulator [Symbiobacteriaceae bacterium]
LRIAQSQRVDAILLDYMMPCMDGPSTYRLLQSEPRTRGIPVIFLTAKVQADDRRQVAALGASGIIPKPFNPVTLASQIAAMLGWAG